MWMAFINNITRYFVIGILLTLLMSLLQSPRANTHNQDHAALDSEQGTKHICSKGVYCKKKWMDMDRIVAPGAGRAKSNIECTVGLFPSSIAF